MEGREREALCVSIAVALGNVGVLWGYPVFDTFACIICGHDR